MKNQRNSLRATIGIGYIFTLAIILLGALAGGSHATTLKYLSINDLVSRASEITHAQVRETYSYWDARKRLIWTRTTIQVIKSFKGNREPGTLLKIQQPGGVLEDRNLAQKVIGTVDFRQDQIVYLFLEPIDSNFYRPVGMFQGVMEIQGKDSMQYVTRPRTGAIVMDPKEPSAFERALDQGDMRLKDFEDCLLHLIRSQLLKK